METENSLDEENQEMTLELTPVLKSFLEAESFATSQKSLFVDGTLLNHFMRKLGLRQSLEHFNQHLQTSSTSRKNGNETVTKNDSLEFPSQV